MHFTRNFVHTCKLNCSTEVVIVCVDKESYEQCKKEDIRCILYNVDSAEKEWSFYGTESYKRLMFAKFEIVYLLISMGYDVLYSDTDVIVQKDVV
jgi:lipopolysaccharide biosynthesis glycosyltransferase